MAKVFPNLMNISPLTQKYNKYQEKKEHEGNYTRAIHNWITENTNDEEKT